MSRIFDRFAESLKKKFVSEDELITSFLNRVGGGSGRCVGRNPQLSADNKPRQLRLS